MLPLYADVFANVGRVILNLLAIAGGFLLGNVLLLIASRMIAKMMLKKTPHATAEKFLRFVGGVLGAILVGLLVFGDGGWGLGGSGGGRPGGPGGSDLQQPEEKTETSNKDAKKEAAKKDNETKSIADLEERVKIVVLGGNAKELRFYYYEDDVYASTLDEIKGKIEATLKRVQLKRLTVFVYRNSAAMDSAVVNDLRNLARQYHLSIDFPPVQSESRPER